MTIHVFRLGWITVDRTFDTMLFGAKRIYWIAQLGWLGYGVLIYIASTNDDKNDVSHIAGYLLTALFGITVTHFFRGVIIRLNWFRYGIWKLLPKVLLGSLITGIIYLSLRILIELYIKQEPLEDYGIPNFLLGAVSHTIIIFLWSGLYFAYHFFEKSRQEEIKNLRWEASRNEIELNNLKAQLNPHFMFNSMNSIRALIDEDPVRAKQAVTQLSTILRNTLLMGKRKTVSLREELEIVQDYLSLESIRFEERLRTSYRLDERLLEFGFPPLMLQTVVENAIKHGISHLPKGGEVEIVVEEHNDAILIMVRNTGRLKTGNGAGIGLENSRKRLELMYGSEGNITLEQQQDDLVETRITIPKTSPNESTTGR